MLAFVEGKGGDGGSRAAAREVCLVWGGGRDGKEEEEEEDSVFQMKPPSSVQPLSPYIFCASAFKSTIILLSPERPRSCAVSSSFSLFLCT